MAICAREALPCGSRIVCPSRTVPLMRPAAFAQESASSAQPDTLAVLLRERPEETIGSVGVFPTDAPDGKGEPEIGYWIGRPFWGQGLIPEAVRELLRWCFAERGAVRVWCGHSPGNDKSRRVIEKCGFTYVCDGPSVLWPDGQERPTCYYAIAREDWEKEARHG